MYPFQAAGSDADPVWICQQCPYGNLEEHPHDYRAAGAHSSITLSPRDQTDLHPNLHVLGCDAQFGSTGPGWGCTPQPPAVGWMLGGWVRGACLASACVPTPIWGLGSSCSAGPRATLILHRVQRRWWHDAVRNGFSPCPHLHALPALGAGLSSGGRAQKMEKLGKSQ